MAIEMVNTYNTCPPRMVIHGGEKVGKSSFCAASVNPIFLPTEEGLKGLRARAAVPQGKKRLETYEEFRNALTWVKQNARSFQSVVIDSADWLELLIHAKICRDSRKNNMGEACGGYGKAYLVALDLWQSVLLELDELNGMGLWIILICHSKSVLFNDPMGEPYDVWTMKLHTPKGQNGSLELLKEWADIIAFAAAEKMISETQTSKANEKSDKTFRAYETGRRLLHLEPTQAFLAGNRYGLRGSCDLTWPAFMKMFIEAMQANQ